LTSPHQNIGRDVSPASPTGLTPVITRLLQVSQGEEQGKTGVGRRDEISAFVVVAEIDVVIVVVTEVPSRPGQPQIVEQTENSVTVSWEAPSWDGGCPLLQYIIERREMRGPRWVRVQKSAVISPPYTATDLLPASCYQFRVYACNVVGVGEPSQMSKVYTCIKTGIRLWSIAVYCWLGSGRVRSLTRLPCGSQVVLYVGLVRSASINLTHLQLYDNHAIN